MKCSAKKVQEHANIAWDTYPEDVPFTNEPKRGWRTKK